MTAVTTNHLQGSSKKETLLRRYTPPTCTLEIWAETSPLSFWVKEKTIPDHFRFELHFDDPRLPDDRQVTMTGDRSQLDQMCDVVNSYLQNFLEQDCTSYARTGSPPLAIASPDSLFLMPQSLLNHQFCFGLLKSSNANPTIILTTSQLLDFTNALEEYRQSLIVTEPASPTPQKSFWVWSSMALVGLIAIGVTGTLLKVLQGRQNSLEAPIGAMPIRSQFTFTEVLPPVPPAPRLKVLPNPSLATNLALRDPLPPPGMITSASPPPRNPDNPLVIPPSRVLPPIPAAPPAPPAVNQTLVISPVTANRPVPTAPYSEPMFVTATNQAPNLPSLPAQNGLVSSFKTLPQPPNLPPLKPTQTAIAPNLSNPLQPITAPPASDTNLLDTIPQVAEVRDYFQKQWQPPEALAQTLEYRLLIKPDGSLDQTIPLGKAATLYLAQIPMPSPGQPFVSALKIPGAGEQTVRLVLSPNGSVKTFLE